MAFGSESAGAGLLKMAKKIDFMKKILRAEADSQSTDRSKHISCIADKLSALEITFLEWVESSAGHGVIDHPETSSPAFSDTESYAVEQMDVASDRKDAEDENRWGKEQEQEVRADGEGEVEEDEKKEQCVFFASLHTPRRKSPNFLNNPLRKGVAVGDAPSRPPLPFPPVFPPPSSIVFFLIMLRSSSPPSFFPVRFEKPLVSPSRYRVRPVAASSSSPHALRTPRVTTTQHLRYDSASKPSAGYAVTEESKVASEQDDATPPREERKGISGIYVPRQKYISVTKDDLLDAILSTFGSKQDAEEFKRLAM
ncbi:hypothetical protein BHM03_00053975 [Ensete ventricosum]|nr:hypothetical protein BHM03_00053975 [Ensete ventricosum]